MTFADAGSFRSPGIAHTGMFTPVVSSLLFALFVIAMPWEMIRGDEFADLVNYTTRIHDLREYGVFAYRWENTPQGWLKFEIAWFALLAVVAELGIEPAVFLSSVTFVCAFLTHRFLQHHLGGLLAAIVLSNPISIDLMSSQIRSALAFSLFLALVGTPRTVGAGVKWARLRWCAMVVLPFIHTAMVLVLLVAFGAKIMAALTRIAPTTRALAIAAFALASAITIATIFPAMVEDFGDRRQLADYGNKTATYVLYWLILGLALVASTSRRSADSWEYAFAIFITLFGTLGELLALPGFRFIALAIPVIFAAMPAMYGHLRQGAIMMSIAYAVLLVYYWVR